MSECLKTIEVICEGLTLGCSSGRITEMLREKGMQVSQFDTQQSGLLAIVNRDAEIKERAHRAEAVEKKLYEVSNNLGLPNCTQEGRLLRPNEILESLHVDLELRMLNNAIFSADQLQKMMAPFKKAREAAERDLATANKLAHDWETLAIHRQGLIGEANQRNDDLQRQLDEAKSNANLMRIELETYSDLLTTANQSLANLDAKYKTILENAATKIADQQTTIEWLREALAFAACCIKSGEQWSETCEQVIGQALAATTPQPEQQEVIIPSASIMADEAQDEPWCYWHYVCDCGCNAVHVYHHKCLSIQCKCGAWISTPKLAVYAKPEQENTDENV